jgi:tRNA-specific 2-thiouridylase
MPRQRPRVIVGMSGGVDSSTAAALLQDKGHDVVGVTLRMSPQTGDPDIDGRHLEALEDACRVAERLGIALQVVDATMTFERTVLSPFCAAYARGLTPNPCVCCNEQVKFATLRRKAHEMGSSLVATGHYVREGRDAETDLYTLRRGREPDDQSYFLFRLSQEQLREAVFPLKGYDKEQVRRIARDYGLPVHDRPDSQDLCFVPPGRYREFLRERCPEAFRPGPIVSTDGQLLGRHEGIGGYTVGQRRGLGIAHSKPLYVVAVRPADNAVVVGEKEETLRREIVVGDVNWVSIRAPEAARPARVKIRYNHAGAAAEIAPRPDDTVHVRFDTPQAAPAPGQAAVFYAGALLLGGGTIMEDSPASP